MDMPSPDTYSETALDPACLDRIYALRDKLAAFRHPHAEQVTEVRAAPDDCTIHSEPLAGESLAQLLERGVRLSFEEARAVVRQISQALEAAHDLGLIHGNLSPEQILFTRPLSEGPPYIKVRGFGIGRPLGDGLFGVPSYLAPEQVAQSSPVREPTPKSDQFALAALLAEMLTGRRAFEGGTVAEVRSKLLHDDPRQVEWAGAHPEDARRVRKALERALSKQPAFRYERLSDFVAALWPRAVRPGSEGMSQLHQVPIQLSVSASLMLRLQDIPTVQTRLAISSQEDTQPALTAGRIRVVCEQGQPAEMEVLRPDVNVTLRSFRPEAETTRSPAAESQPPPSKAPRPGPLRRAEHLLQRLPTIGARSRASVGLGVGLAVGVFLAVQYLLAAKPPVNKEPPAPTPIQTGGPQRPLPIEGPAAPKKEEPTAKKLERGQPVRRPPLACSFVVSKTPQEQEPARAILSCISPLRSRLPLLPFPIQLDANDQFLIEKLPKALIEQHALACLYQARGNPKQRKALREGRSITCR